jgi:EAL domain-containing protein (putative c-di-GMP-specific phosphodiesterase class I)
VLQTGRVTLESLRQLRAHGIAIALDDFGTGYSSLASLQQLPLTRIKLDRTLIDEVDTSTRALAIARSIIGLARNLGLEITAEGIERPEQVRLLASEGPMVMQGFLFSRPLDANNVIVALPMVVQRGRQLLTPHPSSIRSHHSTNDRTEAPVSQKDAKRATPPVLRLT